MGKELGGESVKKAEESLKTAHVAAHVEVDALIGTMEPVTAETTARYRQVYPGRLPSGVSRQDAQTLQNLMEAIVYRTRVLGDLLQRKRDLLGMAKYTLDLREAAARLNIVVTRESDAKAHIQLNADVVEANSALVTLESVVARVTREVDNTARDYNTVSRFLSTQQQMNYRGGAGG